MYRQIIMSKILEYCKKTGYPVKKTGNIVMLECPYCDSKDLSASIIPNTSLINCLKCNHEKFTLLDLVKEHECRNDSDEEILEYLRDILEIDVQTKKDQEKLEKILNRYEKENFCLVPLAKKDKNPVQNDWTNKENRNKEEWASWLINGLNPGVRTGAVSGITVADIDILTNEEKILLVKEDTPQDVKDKINAKRVIPEEIKKIMGEPWIQKTLGGFHLFYKYTNIRKCRIKFDGYVVDLENDGGQVVVEPAPEVAVKENYKVVIDKGTDKEREISKQRIVGYASRQFINDNPIPSMPEALEDLLMEHAGKQVYNEEQSLVEANDRTQKEVVHLDLLEDGSGRNNFFTSYGGYLLKKMSPDQVEYALHGLNPRLCKDPLDTQAIRAMMRGLNRYDEAYQTKLEIEILDYLRLAETASKTDIEIAVLGSRTKGEQKKKVDETLVRLIKNKKIIQKGRQYKFLQDMNWSDNITEVGIPIDFKMPYFHEHAYFNFGDLLIIGATTGYGKTTIAMNIVQQLVEQNIKPYYIYSENGGRFKNKALALGLKDGDFYRPDTVTDEIDDVEFKKGSITIWDWIDPPNFAETNKLFGELAKKVERAKGILIVFVQLKESENGKEPEWFAKNMIKQRPALAVKYLYESEDGTYGKFKSDKIRESKNKGKMFEIPMFYGWKSNKLIEIDKMENGSCR